jgi:type I restriction-modification system DNA methylase subunit
MYSQATLATFFPHQELVLPKIAETPIINNDKGRKIMVNGMVDEKKIIEFVNYASNVLKGDERSEAQIFLERLFQAFGHDGIAESGATLEDRIRVNDRIKFPDLVWSGKVIIEMKSRGENLQNHFDQAKIYWDNAYEKRTEYVILCNFDEFWIYNWNEQKEPKDKIHLDRLKDMWRSLAFLCPQKIEPIFGNNLVDVTEKAAEKIAKLYRSMTDRKIDKQIAQRFTLQCLVALFAEDTGLFPREGFFVDLINDCINKGQSSYDQFRTLFEKMNSKEIESGGKFKEVRYFDGGIFGEICPIELTHDELLLLYDAAKENWLRVQPSIFGNIFEKSLDYRERHKTGSHYTYESDVMRIVEPTILRPWRERIDSAKSLRELYRIWDELSRFRILDPACGSGNFLYISFRELKALELYLLQKIIQKDPSIERSKLTSKIKGNNFYGIDKNPFAVELAKITLSMAKKFAVDDFNKFTLQNRLFLDETEDPLPFDNLDNNIICDDALFVDWHEVDAIIGNPPFQSKNKMQEEFTPEYISAIREQFPGVSGMVDYCVYWFRKTHDNLKDGGRAGLVGTKTIRLDYILSNGGTIIEAVARMPWSGDAVVHVSIVNWIKGSVPLGKRKLAIQVGDKKDGPWEERELSLIPSSLSYNVDVTKAKRLAINKNSGICHQGQIHGNKGFLLDSKEKN